MFRKVIYPPDSEASRQEMKVDCEKRMKSAIKAIVVLFAILLAAFIIRLFDPAFLGSFGTKILGGITAVLIVQGVNWVFEYQQLKKLDKRSE